MLVLINLISYVLYRALTVICFLDVSLLWIESSKVSSYQPRERKQRLVKWYRVLRTVEVAIFIILLGITISLVLTNGQSYSIADSVLVLTLSMMITLAFAYSRYRLRAILSKPLMSYDDKRKQETQEYLSVIRQLSTFIIIANLGIIVTQIYSVVKIRNFDSLVQANNEPVLIPLMSFLLSIENI